MKPGNAGTLERLHRIRRLMEEISRGEVASRRAEQAEMESWRIRAEDAERAARAEARQVLAEVQGADGRWYLHCEDSEASREQAGRWRHRALHAGQAASEAEVLYMEDRRRRMQVETLLEEKAAATALDRNRREQRQLDDWFGTRRGIERMRRQGTQSRRDALPGSLPGNSASAEE
uniref:Flagellar FliJ protein n=1 Tax=Acidobacterium capsulatum TaxID=33075 RepID=A0A7V4XTX7_9BACT